MQINSINEKFSISEQIAISDIKVLAEMGVKILICNRPEGEEQNQLTNEQIINEARCCGIEFIHIPSPGRDIPQDALALFTKTFAERDEKIHAYCRTGTRSSIFWDLMQKQS